MNKSNYQSYLLNCWEVPPSGIEGISSWRFRVRPVSKKGRAAYFNNLPALTEFFAGSLDVASNEPTIDETPSSLSGFRLTADSGTDLHFAKLPELIDFLSTNVMDESELANQSKTLSELSKFHLHIL